MRQRAFGEAGARIVIEEMLKGPECSILAFVDRRNIYIMESAQDHKPVDDGDTGPMTGGMGAYSPAPVVTESLLKQIERDVLVPVLDGLNREEIEYKGVLYAGLMISPKGEPRVVEFNCRFGDPEAQVVLPQMKDDLVPILLACINGTLDRTTIEWNDGACVSVVMASGGYPGAYEKGKAITGIDAAEQTDGIVVFHAGTAQKDGVLVTNGGRVLNVTATGEDLKSAIAKAYEGVDAIHFEGAQRRTDIGRKGLRRLGL